MTTPLARFLAEVLRIDADRTLTAAEAHIQRVDASLRLFEAEGGGSGRGMPVTAYLRMAGSAA